MLVYFKRLSLVLMIFLYTSLTYPNISSTIISKVDNEVITTIDLENEIKTYFILNNISFTKKNIESYKNQLLDGMIKRLVKKNEVTKFKIQEYDEIRFSQYLEQIAKNKNLGISGLKDLFESNKLDFERFKDNLRVQFKWNRLILNIYAKEVKLSMNEIEIEFQKYLSDSKISDEVSYNISEIVINNNEIDKFQEIKSFINQNSFEKGVAKYSVGESAIISGAIGWLNQSQLSKEFNDELKKYKIGEFTKPLKRADKLIILKINDKKIQKRSEQNFEKVKSELVNRMQNQKLEFFSISHYSKVARSSIIKVK
ncbi:MAG: hypothetical protein CL687_00505 [Candidatus Pelagibacter sp.]|nr:hypothetical protein [Candidatus Pelagibacter sp.]